MPIVLVLIGLTLAVAAEAAPPTLETVYPIDGARLLAGQRFDLAVEVGGLAGRTPSWQVELDGAPFGRPLDPGGEPTGGGVTVHRVRGAHVDTPGVHELQVRLTVEGAPPVTTAVRWTVIAPEPRRARNVVLFIGDGMGTSFRTAARIVSRGLDGGRYRSMLEMDELGTYAAVTTAGLDSIIADSANSASAYTTGHKSAVGALGVYPDATPDPNDDPRVETLFEIARRARGMATGIVTTAEVVDATPAALYGHTRYRGERELLATQLVDHRPEVILGGGARWLRPALVGGVRSDGRHLLDELLAAGYTSVGTRAELLRAGDAERLVGLFHDATMNVYLDRAVYRDAEVLGRFDDQPTLFEMTEQALAVLGRHRSGFVLMVEGASIDKAAHGLDWERSVWDTIELDRAVGVARRWAADHGDDTLIVVTADHSHGLQISGTVDTLAGDRGPDAVRTYGDAGFPSYVDADADGFPDRVDVDRPLAIHWANHPEHFEDHRVRTRPMAPTVAVEGRHFGDPRRAPGGVRVERNLPADHSAAVHTAEDVPLSAGGPGSEQFGGTMDNTDVFFALAAALGLDAR